MSAVRKELETIIRRLPPEKLRKLLHYAQDLEEEELTSDDLADIEAGKAEIARGEWVTLGEFCRREEI